LGCHSTVGKKSIGGKHLEWAGAGQGLTVLLSRWVIVLWDRSVWEDRDTTAAGATHFLKVTLVRVCNKDSDQRKIPLHLFTIGFQKPGICADSWFLESNGKKVQFFSDHKSSSAGSIPVSPNPIPNPIPEENKSSHLPSRTCKLMQKLGICADSWFLESNGKKVQCSDQILLYHTVSTRDIETGR
jgi:hypothetical protein